MASQEGDVKTMCRGAPSFLILLPAFKVLFCGAYHAQFVRSKKLNGVAGKLMKAIYLLLIILLLPAIRQVYDAGGYVGLQFLDPAVAAGHLAADEGRRHDRCF